MRPNNYCQPYISPIKKILKTVRAYQNEDVGLSGTLKSLQKSERGSLALYFAAELCLQKASQDYDSKFSSWMTKAQPLFSESLEYCYKDFDPSTALKVELRLASLSNFKLFFGHKTFPGLSSVKREYRQSLTIARDYNDLLNQPNLYDKEKTDILGTLGEFAILALFNRYIIKNKQNEKMFLSKSFLNEDLGNNCLSKDLPKWDIDIFQPSKQPYTLTHRLQVKSSNNFSNNNDSSHEGVTTIHINPDLAINSGDIKIISEIILGCYNEAESILSTSKLNEINIRTVKLLGKVGLSSMLEA